VVLVVVALALTVLMIFAAFAIDLGAARTARRKSQGTVDGGALAGGQLLVTETGTLTGTSAAAIADEVIAVTHDNLTGDGSMTDAGSLTLAQWRARFESCTDPDRNVVLFPTPSTVSDCISFNSAMTRVRVRLPDLNLGTFFATVIGIDTLRVHAEAEVELVPSNAGGVLPFGLLAGNSQSEVCLKSGSQPELPPCDGPVTGNFGTVDINFFGNPVLGTPSACDGYPNTRLEVNIALGIDHLLSTYVSGTPTHEEVACPDLAIHPNQLDGITGLRTHTLDFGLIDGLSLDGHPVEGRLSRGPWATANVRTGSPRIDDKPLWAFLDPALTDTEAPPQCRPSVTTITSRAQMVACLDAYKAGGFTGVLFDADLDGVAGPDLLRSPRLVWVPRFHQTIWGPGQSDPYNIASFQPVFLQTLYFSCGSGPGGCHGVSDPGEAGSGLPVNHNRNLEALTALAVSNAMLPQAVIDQGPNGPHVYTLVLRR
jgi:hypothetical protein